MNSKVNERHLSLKEDYTVISGYAKEMIVSQKLAGLIKKWREHIPVEDRLAQFNDLDTTSSGEEEAGARTCGKLRYRFERHRSVPDPRLLLHPRDKLTWITRVGSGICARCGASTTGPNRPARFLRSPRAPVLSLLLLSSVSKRFHGIHRSKPFHVADCLAPRRAAPGGL